MGIEYRLRIPSEARESLSGAFGERLLADLRALAHGAPSPLSTGVPAASVELDPEGLHVCNHLGHRAIAEQVLGRAVEQLLRIAASVTVEEL